MKGSTKKRGSTWTAYWWVREPNGTRGPRSKGGLRTQRDARAHLNDVLAKVQDGSYSEPKRITLAQYLENELLPTLSKRATTIAQYEMVCRQWVIPQTGGRLLPELTAQDVQGMLTHLSQEFSSRQAPEPAVGSAGACRTEGGPQQRGPAQVHDSQPLSGRGLAADAVEGDDRVDRR